MSSNFQTLGTAGKSRATHASFGEILKDLYSLTKPTITLLVVVTAIPGVILAAGAMPNAMILLTALVGAGLASASAAVFNQVVERESDQKMQRTSARSLPGGRISTPVASVYGLVLGIAGFSLLWTYANPLAAWIALSGHLFYVVFYTMYLKRRTVQNIVIGGAAGAVGPLIGWASVTGSLDWSAFIMFLIIFLWTPPHFWALALKYKNDYAAAGIPMYPVVHGDGKTRKAMFMYTLTLIPAVWALYALGTVGVFYLVCSMLLTVKFSWDAFRLWNDGHNKRAMPLFHYSCMYTFAVYAAMALDILWF